MKKINLLSIVSLIFSIVLPVVASIIVNSVVLAQNTELPISPPNLTSTPTPTQPVTPPNTTGTPTPSQPVTPPNVTATSTPTSTPTQTPTPTLPISGTGYRWSMNATATADTNKVAAPGMNDGNTTQDVALSGGADDIVNGWEAGGIVWGSLLPGITSVEYINGSWTASANGAFTANMKLQFSIDGTTWTDSGWTCTPAYTYDSPSTAGVKYTCSGPVAAVRGIRIAGQVRTGSALSWYANAREITARTGAVVTTTPSPTSIPTVTPTRTPTPTPSGSSVNIASAGTGYRWSMNTVATADTNKVAAAGINDGNTTQDVALNGGADDIANGWEAGGIIWNTTQSGITSAEYINGSWTLALNGAFTAGFKLQYSPDGTTWIDSGWTCTPAYLYDSGSTAGVKYICAGAALSAKGMRITGQVRTFNVNSWYANAREVSVFAQGGSIPPSITPTPTTTGSINIAPNGTGYSWSKNASATLDSNKVAAPGMNDQNTSGDVSLSGGVDDNANGWEAGGVVWATPQVGIKSVEYMNGSWTSSANGAFSANMKLQYSPDGTTWIDSGWTCTPVYQYDSPNTAGMTYTCTGAPLTAKGIRMTGQVRTTSALSWYANAREIRVSL